MDFLNIGSGEFLFLILLAILLIGPRRAVELVQQVSRFAARLQQEWRAVQRDVMQELRALQEETTRAVRPVLQEGDQVRQEAREALRSIAAEVREAQERPTGVSLT
ncbi:MAG: hypothetical protein D6793_00725, partial [Thermoflexia bacterium]